jgi:outer membrane protein assembly factor BamB
VVSAIFLTLCVSTATAGLAFPLRNKWTVSFSSPPSFPPAYDDDFAYVGLSDGQLVSISLIDGATSWSVECPMTSPPAAGGGLVFAGINDVIEARHQLNGVSLWRRPINGRIASLYWKEGWLIAATDAGLLIVLRASDGEILWQRHLGAGLQNVPAQAGDRLYLPLKDGRILAVSLEKGEEIWVRKLDQAPDGLLAFVDRLYVGALDNRLYSLDLRDGAEKWSWRTGADVIGRPAADARRVYFVALDNVVRAHDRRNGSEIWKRVLPMRPSTGPLLSDTTLVVAGVATEIRAYSMIDGQPVGEFILRGSQGEEVQLAAPPRLSVHDLLILTTKGGQMHALTTVVPSPVAPEAGAPPP